MGDGLAGGAWVGGVVEAGAGDKGGLMGRDGCRVVG